MRAGVLGIQRLLHACPAVQLDQAAASQTSQHTVHEGATDGLVLNKDVSTDPAIKRACMHAHPE